MNILDQYRDDIRAYGVKPEDDENPDMAIAKMDDQLRKLEADTFARLAGMDMDQSLEQQKYSETPLSNHAAHERHCEAKEPFLSRWGWIVLGVGAALAVVALIVGAT